VQQQASMLELQEVQMTLVERHEKKLVPLEPAPVR
jgi:hypothetical protein